MTISFIGHKTIPSTEHTKASLSRLLTRIINEHPEESFVFLCGGYGSFDHLCARVVNILKRTVASDISCVYVTPYIDERHLFPVQEGKLYDTIVYPPLESVPYRYAIIKRNEYMISHSDLVIAYVSHTYGGAYQTFLFAKRKRKEIINLADASINVFTVSPAES